MSDSTTDAGTATTNDQPSQDQPTGQDQQTTDPAQTEQATDSATEWATAFGDMTPDEVKKKLDHARTWEKRAKDNAGAAKQLDDLRRSSMSEQEKAVEDAWTAARAATLGEVGEKLARAQFKAAAAGKLPDVDELVDVLDLGKFVTEDGEPDEAVIAATVDKLIASRGADDDSSSFMVDPDQGRRSDAIPLNGDPILRDVKAKLGIR